MLDDGAAEAARAVARGESPPLGALRDAVGEVTVTRTERGGLVCVVLAAVVVFVIDLAMRRRGLIEKGDFSLSSEL